MIKLIKKIIRIINPTLTKRFVYGYFYRFVCDFFDIRRNNVFLESHNGSDFSGNPYYIAKYLVNNVEFRHLNIIFVGPPSRKKWLRKVLGSSRIKVVGPKSILYVFYLATSKWLVSDVTFSLYFSRRPEQKYINTWHGTPLKVLGKNTPGGVKNQLLNSQRNFFHANKIVFPNSHTENVILDSYFLRDIYKGDALHLGYPRNDPLVCTERKKNNSTVLNIAFMPTWRGGILNRKAESQQQLKELSDLLDYLEHSLPSSVNLWVKLHPLVNGQVNIDGYQVVKKFPKNIEGYEHLAICDALITDYSSVFFDFSATRRPIIRYVSDEKDYESDRGFCLDPKTLPFPCARTPVELVGLIKNFVEKPEESPSDEYLTFIEIFNSFDLGNSANLACQEFFNEKEYFESSQDMRSGTPIARECIAIYFGDLVKNLADCSLILNSLDSSRYKFVILIDVDKITQEWEELLKKTGSEISYIVMQFQACISPFEFLKLLLSSYNNEMGWAVGGAWRSVAKREYRRLLGDIKLDVLIGVGEKDIVYELLRWGGVWRKSIFIPSSGLASDGFSNCKLMKEYLKR